MTSTTTTTSRIRCSPPERPGRARGRSAGGGGPRSLVKNPHEELRLLLSPLVPSYCPDFGILTLGPYRGRKILFGPEAAYPWTDFERYRWQRAQGTLRDALAFSREHDIRLLLVYVPIKYRVYRDFIE